MAVADVPETNGDEDDLGYTVPATPSELRVSGGMAPGRKTIPPSPRRQRTHEFTLQMTGAELVTAWSPTPAAPSFTTSPARTTPRGPGRPDDFPGACHPAGSRTRRL